jgi:hypothetical protein
MPSEEISAMLSDEVTSEVPQLNVPADLLAEVRRRHGVKQRDFRVDGLSPSLLERVKRLLGLG